MPADTNPIHVWFIWVGWMVFTLIPKERWKLRRIEKLRMLARNPVELYRGKHICELCFEPPDLVKTTLPTSVVLDPNCSWARWVDQRSSNGEIRVSRDGIVLAAPVLIVHYIEAHCYLPPVKFLKAVDESPL